jgi:signal transduction histidine kinase
MTSLTAPAGSAVRSRQPEWLRRMLTDSGYVLVAFPYGIVSFVVLLVGLILGVALTTSVLVIVAGLPILAGTLYLARGFADGERRLLARIIETPAPRVRYRQAPPDAGWLRRITNPLTDSQYWFDLGHGLLAFPTSLIAFILVVTWWAATLGGLSYVAWFWALPSDPNDQRFHELLGLPDTWLADVGTQTLLGLIFLSTLPLAARGAALVRALPARAMLYTVASLRQQISGLEQEKATAQAQTVAAVSAEATALRRLERDIHDGPQQRLVRLAMDLGRAQHQLDSDPAAARATVAEALAQTRETLDELRALSRGIAPPILADRGLAAAIAALAGRSTVPVEVDWPGLAGTEASRLDPATENAAYFVIAEALTNIAKHSRATECTIALRQTPNRMLIEIYDNGVGGAQFAKGHGLAGLADRVRALGGALAVDSPDGGPTVILAELPCA